VIPPDALDLLLPEAGPPSDSWRWGTITSTSPLRVQLDGDTDPLDVDPDVLTIGMVTGERVYCQLHGRRVLAEHRSPAPFAKSCASLAAANAWYSLCVAQGQVPATDPVWVWRSDTLTLERNSGSGWVVSGGALAAYPVGSIYLSISPTNPGTIFGGTWAAWGTGRVPVAVDAGQTEFNTVEKTGGEKTHSLTETEMPSHTHFPPVAVTDGGNAAGNRSLFATNSPFWSTGDSNNAVTRTGGGAAHNNLPPYITCYMWKRTG
jgi:microcystin-dependent protein